MVALTDVTATLLSGAGVQVPEYMDARPLPGLGLAGADERDILFGSLGGAWMACDGRHKLAKYAGGETLMFDLVADPGEQRDLLKRGEATDLFRSLDVALTQHVMNAIQFSHLDKQVYVRDMSADPQFGVRGWQRRFPRPVGDDQRSPGDVG